MCANTQLVVKYAVPAAFALMLDPKTDVKAAANALLFELARLMGSGLMDAAAGHNAVIRAKVTEALSAYSPY